MTARVTHYDSPDTARRALSRIVRAIYARTDYNVNCEELIFSWPVKDNSIHEEISGQELIRVVGSSAIDEPETKFYFIRGYVRPAPRYMSAPYLAEVRQVFRDYGVSF